MGHLAAGVACTLALAGAGTAAVTEDALFGVTVDGHVARLDPATLRPTRALKTPGWPALSPDGSTLLLGEDRGAVRVADARSMRWRGRPIRIADGPGLTTWVDTSAWLRPDRVFALVTTGGPVARGPIPWTVAAVLDPTRRRVVARRHLPGYVLAEQHVGRREVLLLEPFRRDGQHRLAVVDARGHVDLIPVELPKSDFSNVGFTAVGLAVDPERERAYVMPGRAPIAVVDLRTRSVRYRAWPRIPHRLYGPTRTRPQKNHWGDPVGSLRFAAWLGRGVIAVTGEDDRRTQAVETLSRPFGLVLIDTRRWTARVVDRRANRVDVANGLAFPSLSDSVGEKVPPPGLGLTAYSRSGERLFHRYGTEGVWLLVSGPRAYVHHEARVDILDLPSGRVLRSIPFRLNGDERMFPVVVGGA